MYKARSSDPPPPKEETHPPLFIYLYVYAMQMASPGVLYIPGASAPDVSLTYPMRIRGISPCTIYLIGQTPAR